VEAEVRKRVLDALMSRAAEADWDDIRMADVARDAGVSLADLRTAYPRKSGLLDAYVRSVDDAVLVRASREMAVGEENARDRLFDVVMMRFEAMQPDRAAIARIVRTAGPQLRLLDTLFASQRWMLEVAGIGADGARGHLRTLGLASIYGDAFRVWLKDDDAGLARTMARLDRRLRRAERALRDSRDIACGIGGLLRRGSRGWRRSRGRAESADYGETSDDNASDSGFDSDDTGEDRHGARWRETSRSQDLDEPERPDNGPRDGAGSAGRGSDTAGAAGQGENNTPPS